LEISNSSPLTSHELNKIATMAVVLTKDAEANLKALAIPPAPGRPYSVPIPGSEKEGRSAVYRHWRFRDGPMLETINPAVRTGYDIFEVSAKKFPNRRCLGDRAWDSVTKTWGKYQWQSYAEVSVRAKNFGAGIVALHKKQGVTGKNYGVGLWCQNRPEWQITGRLNLICGPHMCCANVSA
jgi:long-chain acyl-CoA synthetase